jgi:serine protease inhibitor
LDEVANEESLGNEWSVAWTGVVGLGFGAAQVQRMGWFVAGSRLEAHCRPLASHPAPPSSPNIRRSDHNTRYLKSIANLLEQPAPPDLIMDPAFVDIVNRFGFQLQALALEPDKSTGLCAINIYHCLSMVAAGSKDSNLAAFSQALNFDASNVNEMLQKVVQLDTYSKTNLAVDFSSGSSIWHHDDFIPEKPWLEMMRSTFGATVGPLELKPINDFIFKETKGKFKDVIKDGDLAGAVLMLITCLYFKAKWQNPFERWRTMDNFDFHTWEGKTEACSMMTKVDKMEYVEDRDMQACFLPYENEAGGSGPEWRAAIILPTRNRIDAMRDILMGFSRSPEVLVALLKGGGGGQAVRSSLSRPTSAESSSGPSVAARTQKISLSLPRFSLKLNLDLIPLLRKIGLGPTFQASGDFAPISTGPLMISRVTHDLFLEVNEEGTEMAAVTVVAMR